MPSKEELMCSIRPGIKLTKPFFLRIYGYEISYPGFAEQALFMLEFVGSTKAREHYNNVVKEYQAKQDEELKDVAKWYRKECEKEWENKKRKAVSVEEWEIIQKKRELLEKKKDLLKKKLQQ